MKVYAQNYYLLCEPYELQSQSSSGLFIGMENSKNVAKIIDIGNKSVKHCDLKCDDIILYNADKAKEYVLGGKKYIIVYKSDIYAVIKEGE